MNAEERCLIAIDLDDTVLGDLFSLDAKSVWSLMNARDAGHIVMIATARPSCITLPYYRILGMNTLMSVMCGAYMYHPDDPSVPVIRQTIDAPTVGELNDLFQQLGMQHTWLEADDELYSMDGVYPDHPYWRLLFQNSNVHLMNPLPAVECGRIYTQTMSDDAAQQVKDFCTAKGTLRVTVFKDSAGIIHLHIWSLSSDKWYSVQDAARYYGIKPENIITFGDQGIDRLMVTQCENGHVLCNGEPSLIKEMRSLGRGVTEYPCGQGGVGHVLDHLLGL